MVSKPRLSSIAKILIVFALLYVFLIGIKCISISFGLFGSGFAEQLVLFYSNPFCGLFTGILVTSMVQSSSATTSLVVGLAGSGVLPLESAIPMIIGANMGSTITSLLVSFTFVTRKEDFRRAFTAATVHDFFNIFTILVFFPLEMFFHIIEKSALFLTDIFQNIGGFAFASPVKLITKPVTDSAQNLLLDTFNISEIVAGIILLILALIMVIISLINLVKIMRSLVVNTTEKVLDRFLFRNMFTAFLLGTLLTAIVQSSAVTVSMVVGMVAAGFLELERAYPFTLGANIGTTITALLASLVTLNSESGVAVNTIGLTVALSHLMFNIYGTMIFLPLRKVPIYCASWFGQIAYRSKIWAIIFVAGLFYLIPLGLIFLTR
ncbi:MAG: Na/Pi cotransporter family protein [Dehalococcoidales bacterium]|nr:Na/Pi cotransporter family protein [Dehalococcoidales bacterium]